MIVEGTFLNVYKLIKRLQDGIGSGCEVGFRVTMDPLNFLVLHLHWPTDVGLTMVFTENQISDIYDPKILEDYVIHRASEQYKMEMMIQRVSSPYDN